MKDTFIPSNKVIKKQWFIIDAKDKCLGRLATEVVKLLRGKNKIYFSPSQDIGDYVVIINANQVMVTGNKREQKIYMRHSGRPGGKKVETFETLQLRLPNRIIEKAIKGMLPKNRLGRQLFTKLKVYQDKSHPHMGQQPQIIEFT